MAQGSPDGLDWQSVGDGLDWSPVSGEPAVAQGDGLDWGPVESAEPKQQGFLARVAGSLVGAVPFLGTPERAQATVDSLDAVGRANAAQMGDIFVGNTKRMFAEAVDPIIGVTTGESLQRSRAGDATQESLQPGATLQVGTQAPMQDGRYGILTRRDVFHTGAPDPGRAFYSDRLRGIAASGIEQAKRGGVSLQKAQRDLDIPDSGIERYLKIASTGAGPTVAGLVASAATRSPSVGAGVSTMFAVPSAYGEAREAGHEVGESFNAAAVTGLAEWGSERLGFDALFGRLASKLPAGRARAVVEALESSVPGRAVTGAVTEGTTEALSQVAQNVYKVAGLDESMSLDEFERDVIDSFGAGAVMGGVLGPIARTMEGDRGASATPGAGAARSPSARGPAGDLDWQPVAGASETRAPMPPSQAVDSIALGEATRQRIASLEANPAPSLFEREELDILRGDDATARAQVLGFGPSMGDDTTTAAASTSSNGLLESTEAQKEAGNYQKGHMRLHGLDISIENLAGSKRRPEWKPLSNDYGYIRRTKGADGDQVDVFLGPNAEDADAPVFVVDQVNKDGSFDEHKVMLGFNDEASARAGYLANYEDGWTGLGSIRSMAVPEFKEWLRGDTTTPAATSSTRAALIPDAPATERTYGIAAADALRPVLDPDTRSRSYFHNHIESFARKHGLTEEQKRAAREELGAPLTRDTVTGFFKAEERDPLVRAAQQHVESTGERADYVEIDLRNLGGLNAARGHSGANRVYRRIADILRTELEIVGTEFVPVRHGGDEMSGIVRGANRETIDAALARARARVEDFAREESLDAIAHPKGGPSGVGIYAAHSVIEPGQGLRDLYGEVDRRIEAQKQEARHGHGSTGAYGLGPTVRSGTGAQTAGARPAAPAAGSGREGSARATVPASASAPAGSVPYAQLGIRPPHRPRNRVRSVADFDPAYHDIRDFVALRGGLNLDAFRREFGVDPGDLRAPANQRFFGKTLFRKSGGLDPDGLRELLQQHEWLSPDDPDAPPRYTPQDAFHLIERAMDGQPVFRHDGVDVQNRIAGWEREAVDVDQRLDYIDQYGATPEDDEHYARRTALVEALGDLSEIEMREAMTVAELSERATAVGATEAEVLDVVLMLGDDSEAARAARLWKLIEEKERGTDPRPSDQGGSRRYPAREGESRRREAETNTYAGYDVDNREAEAEVVELNDERSAFPGIAEPKRQRDPGQLDILFPPNDVGAAADTAVKRETPKFSTRTALVETGRFFTGITKIESWRDAAHLIAPLRKSPQEQMLAVVVGSDGKALSVIRHTIGVVDGASVEPWSLVGAIAAVPGAHHVYFAHNHPSGNLEQSEADRKITERLHGLMDGSGIMPRGMIVVAGGQKRATYYSPHIVEASGSAPADLPTARRRSSVPQQERSFRRRVGPGDRVGGPRDAVRILEAAVKGGRTSGVILLDTKHEVVGVLDVPTAEMAELRTGDPRSGTARILREVEQANASAAISFGEAEPARNLSTMLNDAGVRVLDVASVSPDGIVRSLSQDGSRLTNDGPFLSRRRSSGPALDDQKVRELASRVLGVEVVNRRVVIAPFESLPEEVLQAADDQQATPDEIRGVHWRGRTYLVSGRFRSAIDVIETLYHEDYVHGGLRARYGDRLGAQLAMMLGKVGGLNGVLELARDQGIDLGAYVDGIIGNTKIPERHQKLVIMEELLAHMGEATGTLRRTIEEWVGLLREFLRKHGFAELADYGVTDLARVLREARQAAKEVDRAPRDDSTPSFSRTPDNGDLFGAPSSRERLNAEERRLDALRNGRASDERTDVLSGDGDLFTGDRPEQDDLTGPRFSRLQSNEPPPRDRPRFNSASEWWQDHVGQPVFNAITVATKKVLANDFLKRHGLNLAEDLPLEARAAWREYRKRIGDMQRAVAEIGREATTLTPEERIQVSDLIENELKAGATPPAVVERTATLMTSIMRKQSQELVELGMLSEESRNRWDGRYLPRFYMRHLITSPMHVQLRQQFLKGIKGGHLKGRGLFEQVKVADIPAYETMGWEVRDPAGAQPDLDGLPPHATVMMWRDFTPAERERMGEVRDSMFRFARGYTETQVDIARGRLFDRIAKTLAQKHNPGGSWVQVPDTSIEGTGLKKFGNLAGLWVPGDVLSELSAKAGLNSALAKLYLKGISLWKEGKTALNPVTHVNNIVSNVVMADLAGVNLADPRSYKLYADTYYEFKKKGASFLEAQDAGLFGGEWYGNEVGQWLPMPTEVSNSDSSDALLTRFGERALHLAKLGREAMGRAYQAEDQFFKLLLYRQARQSGLGPDDAVTWAERFVFDYSTAAPGVRKLRNGPYPFINYSAKAIPALVFAATHFPWRVAKWIAVLGGINLYAFNALYGAGLGPIKAIGLSASQLLGGLLGGDDDDKVRKAMEVEAALLPEYLRGGSSFFGVPKAIRLPFNDPSTDATQYVDISRFVPLGDLFDANNQMGGTPLPAPLMPNNPIITTAIAMLGNKDSFTGKEIVRESDTGTEAAQKRLMWLYRQMAPNNPLVPGSHNFNRLGEAAAALAGEPLGPYTGVDYNGATISPGRAIAQTFGFKLRTVDLQRELQWQTRELRSEIADLKSQITQLNRNQSITTQTREHEQDRLRAKIDAVRVKLEALQELEVP